MKFIHLLLFNLVIQFPYAQTDPQVFYNQFDEIVGSYSGDLNTGQRFEDIYPTNSKTEFRFLELENSVIGTVTYNTQVYYNCSIKYDLLEDNLVFENKNTLNNYAIILDESLVSSFTILDRVFVKLPLKASKFSFYKNGFFEVIMKSNPFNLYVKHEKFARKRVGDKSVYYNYPGTETLVLEHNFEFYEIDSKNDIIKILPDRKEEIKSFYKTYKNLESQNKSEFLKTLLTSLRISN